MQYLLPGRTKLSTTFCKYVSVACELFVSGVQRCCQTCKKITSSPPSPGVRRMAAYICCGSPRLKDLRQTCGMPVTEVRVFGRLRNAFITSLLLLWGMRGTDKVATVLWEVCSAKRKVMWDVYRWVETEVIFVQLEQTARLSVKQVSWGEMRLSYGRRFNAVWLRDEHVWVCRCRGALSHWEVNFK